MMQYFVVAVFYKAVEGFYSTRMRYLSHEEIKKSQKRITFS